MEKEKKSNFGSKFFMFLVFIFICLYILGRSPYYEKMNKDKTLYVEKQIRDFEKDVENGDYIDFSTYVKEENKDYSNPFNIGCDKISNFIGNMFEKGLIWIKKVFSYLFE